MLQAIKVKQTYNLKFSAREQFHIVSRMFKVNLASKIWLICSFLLLCTVQPRTAWPPAWGVLTWSFRGPVTAALPMRTYTQHKQGTFLLSLSLILSQKPLRCLHCSSKWVTMHAYDPRRTWSVGICVCMQLSLTWADLKGKQHLIHSHIRAWALTNDQPKYPHWWKTSYYSICFSNVHA